MISIPWAHHPESAYMYYGKFAVRGWFSPQRTKFLVNFHPLPRNRSHLADSATSTKDPLEERMFVSNGFGYLPGAIGRQLDG